MTIVITSFTGERAACRLRATCFRPMILTEVTCKNHEFDLKNVVFYSLKFIL